MIENLTPKQSWDFMQNNPDAVMIDVRTQMEHTFIGHPLTAVHIAWKELPDWQLNVNFLTQVQAHVNDIKTPILLLCRSGQRSLAAAQLLESAGYQQLINILEGFEGDLDIHKHRGTSSGWRYNQLPWEQS